MWSCTTSFSELVQDVLPSTSLLSPSHLRTVSPVWQATVWTITLVFSRWQIVPAIVDIPVAAAILTTIWTTTFAWLYNPNAFHSTTPIILVQAASQVTYCNRLRASAFQSNAKCGISTATVARVVFRFTFWPPQRPVWTKCSTVPLSSTHPVWSATLGTSSKTMLVWVIPSNVWSIPQQTMHALFVPMGM